MKLYKCCDCGIEKLATPDNFFPVQIEKLRKNPNVTSLGKCSSCAKKYQLEYTEKLKQRKLSRKRNSKDIVKSGTLYVVGPKNHGPYKIGITSGSDMKKRMAALQTAHWLDLEVHYKSPLLENVEKIEKNFHVKYIQKKVKGEWFNIDKLDILDIQQECEKS
jgi:hypothetical protein